jgi:1,4-dihydroxy-6-naphthoate synthase
MSNQLSIAFSPCPNDTFIFDSLINEPRNNNLAFITHLKDVEALNKHAFLQTFQITKLSFHAYLHVQQHYELLQTGAALGNSCGPLLVAKQPLKHNNLQALRIAIPGHYTTANFLLHAFVNKKLDVIPMLFSDIEDAILTNKVDAGVIIHENRFTYQLKGLIKIVDLGDFWQQQTNMPIPLGCIAIHKSIIKLKNLIEQEIQKSIEQSWINWPLLSNYVKANAQEMDEQVIKQHIQLYVNDYSYSLGDKGKAAFNYMQEYYHKIKNIL